MPQLDREQVRRDAEKAQGFATLQGFGHYAPRLAAYCLSLLAELEQAERIRAEYDRELEARTAALEQAERERDARFWRNGDPDQATRRLAEALRRTPNDEHYMTVVVNAHDLAAVLDRLAAVPALVEALQKIVDRSVPGWQDVAREALAAYEQATK